MWAFLAAAAIKAYFWAGISRLVSKALTPSVKSANRGSEQPLGRQTTEEQGISIPWSYGTNRVHANIVAHHTNVSVSMKDGTLWSYLVFGVHDWVVRTTATRRILACFGEGPIEELDLSTLVINGRPRSDFPDMEIEKTRGTVDQAVLPGWESFKQEYYIGQSCLTDEPVTYTMNTTGWTDAEIHLSWPAGCVLMASDGASPIQVEIKIEIGDAIADTWHTLAEGPVTCCSVAPLRLVFLASGEYTGGTAYTLTAGQRPRFRITRLSPLTDAIKRVTAFELTAIQVVRPIGFTHPGMVMMSLSNVPSELLSGGLNELSIESTGRIVSDGDGGFAPTRVHSDIVRDLLTQPVIEGDGTEENPYAVSYYRGIDPSQIVETGFAVQKTLGDTQVPDGLGGTENLLLCDIVVASETNVHSVIGQVCASGRCGIDYRGRHFGMWVDAPREPVGLLSDGNCQRGSIAPVPIPHDDLASEATVRFRDAAAAYRDRTIQISDPVSDSLTTVSLDLPGVTRTSDAARLLRRELARNRLTDLSLRCVSDVGGCLYEPGDVVYSQIDGRSIGGRIETVDGRTVTLSQPVSEVVTGDDVLIVEVRDAITGVPSVEVHAVATVDGPRQVTIDEDWDQEPSPKDPFLFGSTDIQDDQFEVQDIQLAEHLFATLSLSRYVPALDDLDEVAPGVRVPLAKMGAVDYYGGVRHRLVSQTIDEGVARTVDLVGDGVTDETETLQAMIDEAILNGSPLVLPRGVFRTTDTLHVGDGVTGISGFTMRTAGWEQAKILYDGDPDQTVIEFLSVNGLILENIYIDGNDVSGVTGIYHSTGASASAQFTTIRGCGVVKCAAVGYHVKQFGPTCDYVMLQNCALAYNGEGAKIEGGVRQVAIHSGAIVNSASYGIHIVDGHVSGYDLFMGLNGYDFDASEQVGSDIYLSGPIASVAIVGGASESLVILDGDWSNDAGWSRLLTPNAFYSLNQAAHVDVGGEEAIDVAIVYDCARPLILSGCKLMGDVSLGSRVSSVQSIHTDFYNYERQPEDANPITGFIGVAAEAGRVNIIGRTDNSVGTGDLTNTTLLANRMMVAEDGWLKGIDILSIDGTVFRRIGWSDVEPDTYYSRLGWVFLNSNMTESGPFGWVCTAAGDGSAETTKAVFREFGSNLIGAETTTFARESILAAEDSADLVSAMGLGTMAQQDSDDVEITGGSVSGITDLAVADGGTGASTAAAAATNLGLGTGDSPQFTAINVGHASDTTLSRPSGGDLAIEGNLIYRAGGTDVPVADGGTGASTAAAARGNLGIPTLIDGEPTAKTADYSILSTDTGKHFTNAGASGAVELTLPSATVGLRYAVTRVATQVFNLLPASGEKFAARSADAYFALGGDDCHIEVKCLVTGVWHIMAQWGAYTWV